VPHQTFLKRKFNQRTRAVFALQKREASFVFLFPALIGGEGIGNPEGGF